MIVECKVQTIFFLFTRYYSSHTDVNYVTAAVAKEFRLEKVRRSSSKFRLSDVKTNRGRTFAPQLYR